MPTLGLIVWEQTEEFDKFFKEAKQKQQELVDKWKEKYGGRSYVGPVEPGMSEDGEAVFWINDLNSDRTYHRMGSWPAEEALKSALKSATFGWCTLSDLEQLIEGRGPLLIKSMEACGFRPHKRIPDKWVRIRENPAERAKHFKEWQRKGKEKEKRDWPSVSESEQERLSPLWISPNAKLELNQTYSIQVSSKGLIYITLEVNPFSAVRTEQLDWFGAMLRSRGHIAKEQNGFQIEARNVKFGKEKGIYIKAVRPDGSYLECVWPHYISQEGMSSLTHDLASRMRESPVSS